jgi:hypothetical protein
MNFSEANNAIAFGQQLGTAVLFFIAAFVFASLVEYWIPHWRKTPRPPSPQ